MAATKEAILAKEHEPGLDVTVFFLDLRAFGKDFDRYCDRAKNQLGVRFVRSFISRTYEMPDTRNLRVVYADAAGKGDRHLLPERPEGCFAQKVPVPFSGPFSGLRQTEDEFDMIVLSLGLEPSATLQEQANGWASR